MKNEVSNVGKDTIMTAKLRWVRILHVSLFFSKLLFYVKKCGVQIFLHDTALLAIGISTDPSQKYCVIAQHTHQINAKSLCNTYNILLP